MWNDPLIDPFTCQYYSLPAWEVMIDTYASDPMHGVWDWPVIFICRVFGWRRSVLIPHFFLILDLPPPVAFGAYCH